MSASTSRPLPAEIAESAHLVALIERGRAQGHIAADEVRQAFEEADIPMAKAKSVMRALTTVLHEEGVDLTVNATQSAGVARKRVAAASKTAAKKTTTATAAKATTVKKAAAKTAAPGVAAANGASGDELTEAGSAAAKKAAAAKKTAAKKTAASAAGADGESGTGPAKKAAAKKGAPAKKAAGKKGDGEDGEDAELEEDVDLEIELDDEDGPDMEVAATDESEETSETDGATPGEDKEEGFVLSDDEDDAPAQQVASAGATADPVKDYLKQIGKVPLLNAEQEVVLAKRIEAGLLALAMTEGDEDLTPELRRELEIIAEDGSRAKNHLLEANLRLVVSIAKRIEAGLFAEEKLNDGEPLTPEFRRELDIIAEDGRRAKNHLLEANLRLVVSLAKRYTGRGMLFLDLIQEGNLGLIRAVEKFDYTKGYKFSTYATWWIRQAITRAMADQARTIRIPVHMVEVINKLARVQRQMLQDLGREPTPEELAKELDMTPEKVVEVQKYGREPISLHTPLGEDGDSEFGDLIEDSEAVVPADAVSFTLLQEQLHSVLDTLSEREAGVVSMRFGLTDGQPKTLDEIGKVYGVTRERIRQIESKTMSKLRHPSRSQVLRDYLD